jgi:hypothetical protein
MSDENKSANPAGHGDYERRDIGVSGVLYFLFGLAVFGFIIHLAMSGFYSYLDKRSNEEQAPVSPLVTNAPTDTRHLPAEYKTDAESTNYEKYLEKNFPAPQLETDERTQLNKIRVKEEQILNSYDYMDQKAGTVRIPIERAMDLIAQRGLPVRSQASTAASAEAVAPANAASKKKATK